MVVVPLCVEGTCLYRVRLLHI